MSTDLARFEGKALEHAQRALEFEEEAARYPEEAGQCLLEASANWRWAGDLDRTVAVLETVIARGGEDAQYARAEMADLRFEVGDTEAAMAELAALRAMKPLEPGPCHMVAEMFEEHGLLTEALTWFNMATTRLPDGELEAAMARPSLLSYSGQLLLGRQRVRRALGMPPDELDEAAPEPWRPGSRRPVPPGVLTLYWPRSEYARAAGEDPDGYYRDLESILREAPTGGAARIVLVPATFDGLVAFAAETGGTPEDRPTRQAYADELAALGLGVAWPPARNGPCWCGSGAKYKKCHGR